MIFSPLGGLRSCGVAHTTQDVFRHPNVLVSQVGIKVPLIVRLEGTNVEKGKEILKSSGMDIIPADDLDNAAVKAVASIK